MNYEFLNKDGSRYTLMDTETPERDLEGIQKYNPDVVEYREYIEPDREIIPEESADVTTEEEDIMEV